MLTVRPFLTVITLCVAIGGVIAYWYNAPTVGSLIAEARQAVAQGDYHQAMDLALQASKRDRANVEALLLAAEAAKRSGDPIIALEHYRRLPETEGSRAVVEALKDAGQLAIHLGHATDAERFYKRALRWADDDLVIHRRLAALYLGEARRWESTPHLFALVRGQAFTLEELAFLGNLEELYDAEQLMDLFERSVAGDVAPLIGRARLYLFKNFPEKGEALLRRIIAERPDLIEAQAQLGVVLVSESRDADFETWHRQLPSKADDHPEIWWVRATSARKHGDPHVAIRCAWEALRRHPNHVGAMYQLAQLLAAEGRPEQAQVFAERAAKLEALATNIHDVLLREPTAERMLKCARLCEDLGRLWEAWGWHVAVETYHPKEVLRGERERLKGLLTPDLPQTRPSHSLAYVFDFSHYPLPGQRPSSKPIPTEADQTSPAIRFEDVASAVGLDFRYENGAQPDQPGLMIYQSIGGGVAVIDYDWDGAPDLYFPQAGSRPSNTASSQASDALYRNAAGQCIDVAAVALTPDAGYGFGAAVGDFDADGLPDLYLANAGRNRLLQNNGDGTFNDVTAAAGLPSDGWTSSCLLADVNRDGLPDLYDVNYCAGDRPLTHVCYRSDKVTARTCIPTEFAAADDRVLINLGDGRFKDVSGEAGILAPEGRGLGIVAANFDDEPGIDLYVANDMTANFLFLNRTSSPGEPPRFDERGVISGAAYDFDGRPQASMGIAADDADGDGLLDLFLTNFYNESNTLYRQQPGRFFIDETREFDLRTPSMPMLGFGTQFLDANLDGRPDLVVANGHVDDYREQDIPFRMKPQFFSNQGRRFVEVPSEQLGPFFTFEQLGRGLARVDWDRNGREDFVVSRLFDPASLVINHTPTTHRFLAVRLTGRTDRDAMGAEVRVTAGGRTLVKQLTAGDGFECSNQRQLVFGLSDAPSIDEVRIHWPAGTWQTFPEVPINREVQFVEGVARTFPLPKEEP